MVNPEYFQTQPTPPEPVHPVHAGSLVAHTHDHPSHGESKRHGLVTKVHEPVIVGRDTDGNDVQATHANVAWFGLDGETTVPVDELDPID